MAPTPSHSLRTHAFPLHALAFSPSGQALLYAGDEDGFVSITDLRLRRVVAHWKAHDGGVLTVGEWDGGLVSHGRDNQIHFYSIFPLLSGPSRGTGLTTLQEPPKVVRSLTVNSLNFCKFGLAEVPGRVGSAKGLTASNPDEGRSPDVPASDIVNAQTKQQTAAKQPVEGVLAVPNLIDTESVDIYALPSLLRIHAAILPTSSPLSSCRPSDAPRSGLVMALYLYFTPQSEDEELTRLRLVVAFEDGRVESWSSVRWKERSDRRMKLGPDVWQKEWTLQGHNEAIMAMTVSPTHDYAYTVSADHHLCRYSLGDEPALVKQEDRLAIHPTKQIGNACVAVTSDGRVVAVGGWDGVVRLYSAKSFKPLGILDHHRDACHAIAFAPAPTKDVLNLTATSEEGSSDDEEYGALDRASMARWMVSGGKDKRIALWELKDFARRDR